MVVIIHSGAAWGINHSDRIENMLTWQENLLMVVLAASLFPIGQI
jgi:hypothetical protein